MADTAFYIPLLPCPPDNTCPTRPCPGEDPCEQTLNYQGCNSWWKDQKPCRSKLQHSDCWCNGWNVGDGYGRRNCGQPIPKPPVRPKREDPPTNFRVRRFLEKQLREKLYPPPPANVCNFKPCLMEMKPPSWNKPIWTGFPQKCPSEPVNSFYVPGECKRPGCLHISDIAPMCCHDLPCKAHCFEQNPCTKPRIFPRGFPHQ